MSCRRLPSTYARSSSKQPTQQVTQKKVPAELVTYRLGSDMVYVEPAQDFEQALDFAQGVFPQLAEVPRSRIAFSVNVRVNGALRTVRIAPMAWARVMRSLATYEILDISVLPILAPSRAARSESELATTSSDTNYATGVADDSPPKYGCNSMLGADLYNPLLDTETLRDSEKSPLYTLQVPETPLPPQSLGMKRSTSALSWFSKRL